MTELYELNFTDFWIAVKTELIKTITFELLSLSLNLA